MPVEKIIMTAGYSIRPTEELTVNCLSKILNKDPRNITRADENLLSAAIAYNFAAIAKKSYLPPHPFLYKKLKTLADNYYNLYEFHKKSNGINNKSVIKNYGKLTAKLDEKSAKLKSLGVAIDEPKKIFKLIKNTNLVRSREIRGNEAVKYYENRNPLGFCALIEEASPKACNIIAHQLKGLMKKYSSYKGRHR